MLSKSQAKRLAKYLLPPSVLLAIALSVLLGIALAQPSSQNLVVEIVMLPSSGATPTSALPTTMVDPEVVDSGDTVDFIVRVLPNGELVQAVSLSMTFETQFLEVVDTDFRPTKPGVQIQSHPGNPLTDFTIDNIADNIGSGGIGTINFTMGSQIGASGDFNFAIITFRAKENAPSGSPTEVVFRVDPTSQHSETAVSRSGIPQLLLNTTDFPGAWISVVNRPVEIEMLPVIQGASAVLEPSTTQKPPEVLGPPTTQADPEVMGPGETTKFIVQVDAMGAPLTVVTLSMIFKTQYLEIVDADPGKPGIQILTHPDSHLIDLFPENTADNTGDGLDGTIRYTAGSQIATTFQFPLATITFRAKAETPSGNPTEVVFIVGQGQEAGNETQVFNSAGDLLLKNTEDFIGAWIEVTTTGEFPTAVIEAPPTGDEGSPVSFNGGDSTPGTGVITSYDWDFGDGTTGDGTAVNHTYKDDGIYPITLTVTDSGGGTDNNGDSITIFNVAPNIPPGGVTANPSTLSSSGGTSTITVNATDPGVDDILLYSFDCDDDLNTGLGGFEVAPQTGNTADCSFDPNPTTGDIIHTVNVKVDDQDGGAPTGSTTVTVQEPVEDTNDWAGTLNITGTFSNGTSGNLTGNHIRVFGIRPGCTDGFELLNTSGDACDAGEQKIPPPDELKAYFYYPNNPPNFLVDSTNLKTSRIAPPSPARQTLRWPLRVLINKLGATTADITIQWDITTPTRIPNEFITVLLIDHSPAPPLPPFSPNPPKDGLGDSP